MPTNFNTRNYVTREFAVYVGDKWMILYDKEELQNYIKNNGVVKKGEL